MTNQLNPFGEIIQSSLSQWTVHCWNWDQYPAFGSLVTITEGERTLYGIVTETVTGSNDPSRVPFPYQKTHAELLKEHPQIFALLQTTSTIINVGYLYENTLTYQISPYPPKIHSFVREADENDIRLFFSDTRYIHLLCNANFQSTPLDELMLAILTRLQRLNILKREYLHEVISQFSLARSNDYKQLKLFLQRVQMLNYQQ